MDEKEALLWLAEELPVGDDCFVLERDDENLILTTDMLHRESDFPPGLTHYSIGWRSCAVSLSDVAAMGGNPEALLLAYGAEEFEKNELEDFFRGAREVCENHGAGIVGGDLDNHSELTVVTTALGNAENPISRVGARPGDLVAVSGELGRTATGLKLFGRGETERANELFRFSPEVEKGEEISNLANSMMDISDGLARSLHQMAEENEVGFTLDYGSLPFSKDLQKLAENEEELMEMGLYTGEDYRLLFTVPGDEKFEVAKRGFTVIGEVTRKDLVLNVEGKTKDLEDRGFVH